MGYTITSQSSLSIHAVQTWSLVEIAVIPAGELTFVTFALDGKRLRQTPRRTTVLVRAQPVAAQEVSFPISLSGYSALDQPVLSVAQQTDHRILQSTQPWMAQISHGSSRQFACGHLPAIGIDHRELLFGADAGQGPLLAHSRRQCLCASLSLIAMLELHVPAQATCS